LSQGRGSARRAVGAEYRPRRPEQPDDDPGLRPAQKAGSRGDQLPDPEADPKQRIDPDPAGSFGSGVGLLYRWLPIRRRPRRHG